MKTSAWVAVPVFIAVAVASLTSASTPVRAAGSAPVTIVNPLPLPVNGSVSATQSGTWTVGIRGSVPVTSAMPQAFQLAGSYDDWVDGQTFRNFVVDVPAGNTLVVEQVSFRASVPTGQLVYAELSCQGAPNASPTTLYVPMVFQGTFNEESLFVAAAPTRCYAGGTDGLLAHLIRSSPTGTGNARRDAAAFSIAGHLEAQN